jgi:hypothetical protein
VPVPFFTAAALARVLSRVRTALTPDGWVVCGLETLPQEPLARALSVLRTVRGGGEISEPAEAASSLTAAGFTAVEIAPAGLLTFVLGRPEK